MQCQNIRCPKLDAIRCRNKAKYKVGVHQEGEHSKIGGAWFVVYLCERCVNESQYPEDVKRYAKELSSILRRRPHDR